MKYLIAGLGNPGEKYVHTRHNIGFQVLDALASRKSLTFSDDKYVTYTEYKHKGRSFYLIKPQTYMNLSGKAVRYWLQKLQISPDRLLVITDDIALAVGKIRIRAKGSDGGHNGLKSIQALLETNFYPRLRFGVGNDFGPGQQSDYVLGDWSNTQKEMLKERIELAADAVEAFGTLGIERTMTFFNGK